LFRPDSVYPSRGALHTPQGLDAPASGPRLSTRGLRTGRRLLWQLLTGSLPFAGYHPAEILGQVLHTEPAPVATVEPDTPPDLVAICSRAMDKDPAARYPSAKALADDVPRCLSPALPQGLPVDRPHCPDPLVVASCALDALE